MIEKLTKIKEALINAKKSDMDLKLIQNESINSEKKLKSLASIIKFKHDIFPELINSATKINKEKFNKKIEFYAVSYISDHCINNCSYCGHKNSIDVKRETLKDKEIALDFASRLKFGPTEICILTGQHPTIDVKFLKNAGNIALKEDTHNSLENICFNVAPMSTKQYEELNQSFPEKLQIRIFQESYDKKTYLQNHPCGPKRNFEYRLFGQERAIKAGVKIIGVGALLGLNKTNEPYKHFGNDYEVMSLIVHSYYLKEKFHIQPSTASIPRHQKSPKSNFETPNKVDDIRYILYHSILRNALPSTKLIITNRERKEMINLLRPMVNIQDLAARPGVGGNYKSETHMQNELGDVRSPLELINDVKSKGFTPVIKL